MRQQMAEISRIVDNPAPATFENTLVELEKSGELLSRVLHVFSAITGANTSDFLQQVQEDVAPKLAAHEDASAATPGWATDHGTGRAPATSPDCAVTRDTIVPDAAADQGRWST